MSRTGNRLRLGKRGDWLELNRKYSEAWPNITGKKAPLPGADDQNGRRGKASEFSPRPATEEAAAAAE